MPVADLWRKRGLSSPTFYKWRAKYGGLYVSEVQRLKALEDANAKLKRMLADAMLDNVALKDLRGKVVRPAAHLEAAAYLQSTYGISERPACQVIGSDRASVRYQATRPDDGSRHGLGKPRAGHRLHRRLTTPGSPCARRAAYPCRSEAWDEGGPPGGPEPTLQM